MKQKKQTPTNSLLQSMQSDFDRIYKNNQYLVGWPKEKNRLYEITARKNTAAIVGAALGDEGKGRFIDNTIATLLQKPGIKKVYVIRYQGGNNAGHSVEKGDVKLALHVVPSAVFYPDAIGIMDRGMIIHPEDLQTEILYAEKHVGSLQDRLFLSDDAIFSSDLERAEEQLNRVKEGKSKGGTGRGIAPSYAHHYDKTGLHISDLLETDWEEKLRQRYDRYAKEFAAYDLHLADVEVPDFHTIKTKNIPATRSVGDKKTFIERLRNARAWLVKRGLIINTFVLYTTISDDPTIAILFEGAQAAGLDAWNGTRPDVTASNTSAYGVREGTAFWRGEDIANRIGIIKIPYTSSVGARKMPTHIDLPKDLSDLKDNATKDQQWAAYVRETAHEYGTTTGRPRDINHLDLAFIEYNARMSGIETLAVTHTDVSRNSDELKVCTHYTDSNGAIVPYQPGLRYLKEVSPQYITLPGWDGEQCRNAKSVNTLPENCKKFLAFIQARTGFPIVAATTGPERENFIAFPGYIL